MKQLTGYFPVDRAARQSASWPRVFCVDKKISREPNRKLIECFPEAYRALLNGLQRVALKLELEI